MRYLANFSPRVLAAAVFLLLPPSRGAAAAPAVSRFPSSREYFEPLAADPNEPGYGGRYVLQVGGDRFGEVSIGDTVGVLRRDYGGRAVQLNLAGGALARFNFTTEQNSMEVVDFMAGVPVDMAWGREHAVRAAAWHTSSHLGDDLIARLGVKRVRRSMDFARAVYAWSPRAWARLYAGGAYAFNVQGLRGRGSMQFGTEWYGPPVLSQTAQPFAAQDLQTRERVGWNPSYNLRAGLRFADSKHIAAARVFVEYFTGRQYFLQFLEAWEHRWTFGLNFEIGNPTR